MVRTDPVLISVPPPRSPLFIGFTVLDANLAAFGGERAALESFAARLARTLAQRGVPAECGVQGEALIFVIPRGQIIPASRVYLALANLPRSNQRAQFELHTLCDLPFDDLPADQQWPLARFHEQLIQLVIAWQETEDVDAGGLASMQPPDAHVYGEHAPPKPPRG